MERLVFMNKWKVKVLPVKSSFFVYKDTVIVVEMLTQRTVTKVIVLSHACAAGKTMLMNDESGKTIRADLKDASRGQCNKKDIVLEEVTTETLRE